MRVRLGRKIDGNRRSAIEREINLFKDDHYLWHKHVTGIELNPHQVHWCQEMDKRGDSHMLIGSRRIRKSFTIASYLLKEAATKPATEVNIHSPALEQSKRNMAYITDMVMNSEILLSYVDERLGEGIGKEHLEFLNRSAIRAKGQASSIDGLGATHQWLEEFDDMDWDTFLTRIYPTGSQLKDDHEYGNRKGCFRIITGTIKGVGNIHRIEYPEVQQGISFRFNILPKLTAHHGIAMGIIPAEDIAIARSILFTPHQFARTYLVMYVESATFYPERAIRACADHDMLPIIYDPYVEAEYQSIGDVTVGIDAGGAGSYEESSNWAITFTEKIGNKIFWLYSKEWGPNERPDKIKLQMANLIKFFRPVNGFHDAFDPTFCYDLNRHCYDHGITQIDVRKYENKQGSNGWDNWFIKPIRFTGPQKHYMHERMQKYICGTCFRYPTIVDDDPRYAALDKLIRQFSNVKAERGKAGYNKYSSVNTKLGLDLVDSCIASVWAQEEIKAITQPYGSWIPQFEIGARHVISPLGPKFLHDKRTSNQSKDDIIYRLLKE